jgi:hypothetical protein
MIHLYPRIYRAAQSALSQVFAMMKRWQHLGKCNSEQEVQSWLLLIVLSGPEFRGPMRERVRFRETSRSKVCLKLVLC